MNNPAPSDPSQATPDFNKLDPYTRMLLSSGALGDRFECLMRTGGALTDDQRLALQTIGVKIRVEIGDIIAAEVPKVALGDLLRLDFIMSVEASRPMYLDSDSSSAEV